MVEEGDLLKIFLVNSFHTSPSTRGFPFIVAWWSFHAIYNLKRVCKILHYIVTICYFGSISAWHGGNYPPQVLDCETHPYQHSMMLNFMGSIGSYCWSAKIILDITKIMKILILFSIIWLDWFIISFYVKIFFSFIRSYDDCANKISDNWRSHFVHMPVNVGLLANPHIFLVWIFYYYSKCNKIWY